ncbi:hypothetical protein Q8F55_003227 [Vanrija albida]|uniref:Uncharacterized protein n=1 Tax=Vanrija albida TaxID=181172 RepID=A0ABR3QCX1_9TREE
MRALTTLSLLLFLSGATTRPVKRWVLISGVLTPRQDDIGLGDMSGVGQLGGASQDGDGADTTPSDAADDFTPSDAPTDGTPTDAAQPSPDENRAAAPDTTSWVTFPSSVQQGNGPFAVTVVGGGSGYFGGTATYVPPPGARTSSEPEGSTDASEGEGVPSPASEPSDAPATNSESATESATQEPNAAETHTGEAGSLSPTTSYSAPSLVPTTQTEPIITTDPEGLSFTLPWQSIYVTNRCVNILGGPAGNDVEPLCEEYTTTEFHNEQFPQDPAGSSESERTKPCPYTDYRSPLCPWFEYTRAEHFTPPASVPVGEGPFPQRSGVYQLGVVNGLMYIMACAGATVTEEGSGNSPLAANPVSTPAMTHLGAPTGVAAAAVVTASTATASSSDAPASSAKPATPITPASAPSDDATKPAPKTKCPPRKRSRPTTVL